MYPYFKKWEILEIWEKFTKWMFFHEKSKIFWKFCRKKCTRTWKILEIREKFTKLIFSWKIENFGIFWKFSPKKVYFKKYKIESFAEKSN
jgi:hypothetical protein